MNKGLEFIGGALGCALFAAFTVWLGVNWVTGCGETIYTAAGIGAGECIGFLELWGL
jgi:hypothetical protein